MANPVGAIGDWYNYEQALLKPPSFVRDEDMQVFRLLRETSRRGGGYTSPCPARHRRPRTARSRPRHRPHLRGAG